MGFLGLFRLKLFQPEQFEQQLTALTQAISLNKEQISALTRKQKAWCKSLGLYCTVLYLSYFVFRYNASFNNMGVLAHGKSRVSVFLTGQLTKELTAIFLPAVIVLVVYVINAFFGVLIRSKKHTLKSLLQKHKAKLEELKTVTNFSRTNQILQKFDTKLLNEENSKDETKQQIQQRGTNINTNKNKNTNVNTPLSAAKLQTPVQPQVRKLPPTVNVPNVAKKEKSPVGGSKAPTQVNSVQPGPTKLSFQDRLLDFIIGSEHNENVENRYALICANCYTHNGLAPPGCKNPVSVTYICRHCGYINGDLSVIQARAGPTSVPLPESASKQEKLESPVEPENTGSKENVVDLGKEDLTEVTTSGKGEN